MKKVYIAGPYTKPDPAINTATAMRVWHLLAEAGAFPFCPHLTHFLHILKSQDYEFWMQQDLAWLHHCDVLYRIPGESSGADREVRKAETLGIPVFHHLDEVIELCKQK